MTIVIQGNFISIIIPPNEGNPPAIQLPDGYSYERIHISVLNNITYLIPYMQISVNNKYTFPVIDSMSPWIVQPLIGDTSRNSEIKFFIEKFGKIPNIHYFDKAFTPILVTGDDGKEYNVIPSDQFK